ncbi:MAG: DUF4388 domain-containing protein [Blastochloris sp.]|nr:DUF4388 domain-containing protein [Blastochloris sp.]
MSSSTLPDHLQIHGQAQETGCLLVEGPSNPAVIYLLDGSIVFAECMQRQGLVGIYLPLTWEEPKITWQPRVPRPQGSLPIQRG